MRHRKSSVTLRERKIKGGRKALYLDIYAGGKRRYEYLRLYLIPEESYTARMQNKDTMRIAEAVRAKRLVELMNGAFGFRKSFNTADEGLYAFLEEVPQDNVLQSLKSHLRRYQSEDIPLSDIDIRWVDGFKRYLDNTALCEVRSLKEKKNPKKLKDKTKDNYLRKLRACLNRAVRAGIIDESPMKGMRLGKTEESLMTYLTLDEVRKLARTECKDCILKRAFLFSCLTGLRISDVRKLVWREVTEEGGYTRLTFRQKKTKGLEYTDISGEAVRYMGERGADSELVFGGLKYGSETSTDLREWALRAGITKPITYHTSRHTYAVMMLELGADIYTLSKLLGHKSIATTQVYAKVTDRKKQQAIELIPKIE